MKTNALAGCETLTLGQLAGEPLVVLDDRAEGFSRMNEEVLRFFTQRGCAPCDIRRTEQIETLGLKLSECKGYALTPASLQFPHRDYLRRSPLREGTSLSRCASFSHRSLESCTDQIFRICRAICLAVGRSWLGASLKAPLLLLRHQQVEQFLAGVDAELLGSGAACGPSQCPRR